MNEKKDKKSKKPECVSKNWKSSQGIRLLAMVLAIVSGFFVAVTGVITVTLGMTSDLQGSQKDIEKTLDTELLRSYAYWMGDAVTGISKKQDEADALKKFDDGNIVYSLVKKKPKGKETELVCGNNTGTLNKENALAWLKFTDENEFHTNDRSFWDMLLGRNRGQYMQKVKHYTQVDHFIYDNGVIYCYAGDTLFRINSFSFSTVPEESDLEPYVEYTYRESDDGGRYCAENGEQLKKGKLEPYLKSSELRFDFDGLEAGYLWSKKDGIYPIRQESIADTYAKAKVFQWQDFSFAYEDQQGRIYYNPHQEKEATEYTLYLTAADSLKGSNLGQMFLQLNDLVALFAVLFHRSAFQRVVRIQRRSRCRRVGDAIACVGNEVCLHLHRANVRDHDACGHDGIEGRFPLLKIRSFRFGLDVHALALALLPQRKRAGKGHVDMGVEAQRMPHRQAAALEHPLHHPLQVQQGDVGGLILFLKRDSYCNQSRDLLTGDLHRSRGRHGCRAGWSGRQEPFGTPAPDIRG